MAESDTTKSIVSLMVSKLVECGFKASHDSNALVKNGANSFVVQVFNVNEGVADSFCEAYKDKTKNFGMNEFAHHVAYEMIFLCPHPMCDEKSNGYRKLYDLYLEMKKSGMVCDVVLFDNETYEYQKVGGGKIISKDVEHAVKETGKEMGVTLTPEEIKKRIRNKQIAGSIRKNYGRSNMKVIFIIMAINVMIFLSEKYLVFSGREDVLLINGIQNNEAILNGEWWRLITAMFLHADIGHLFGNMLSLMFLGRAVSKFYKKWEIIVSYLVCGLFGNVLSLFFVEGYSLGASGAVMGLGGLLIFKMFFSKEKQYFRNTGNYVSLVIMVVFNLLYGVIVSWKNINNYAHFGGFILGFLIAFIAERILIKNAMKKKNR